MGPFLVGPESWLKPGGVGPWGSGEVFAPNWQEQAAVGFASCLLSWCPCQKSLGKFSFMCPGFLPALGRDGARDSVPRSQTACPKSLMNEEPKSAQSRTLSACPWLPGAYVPEGLLTSCSWDYMSFTPSVRAYTMLLFCFVFFLPLLVIIYCYIFIFRAIRETGQ